jgi:GNAT superfamily N-acetyltransferase
MTNLLILNIDKCQRMTQEVEMDQSSPVEFSPIDSARFLIRVARAHRVTELNLPEILDFCTANRIDLLIARCCTDDIRAAQNMQGQAFLIMDTLVYFTFNLVEHLIPSDSVETKIRSHRPEDTAQVREIAATAFQGYRGHYHADPKLDFQKCNEAYVSWAERACTSRGVSDEVLIAEHANRPVGFASMRLNSSREAEGILFAVAPEAQRLGTFRSLLISSMHWAKQKNMNRMVYSTQLINVPVQKVLCRVGFEPSRSYYTFHKWFAHA